MDEGFPRVLGDIGGTHARWVWQEQPHGALQRPATYACAAFDSVHAVLEHYLAEHALPRPRTVGFGIATPITGDQVAMTNHPWTFSIRALMQALGVAQCLVLNDFAALAQGLLTLTARDTVRIGGGEAAPQCPIAVLGPGTGLGVAALVPVDATRGRTLAGEGGHATLAATTPREAQVVAALQQRFGHVSAERAVSGPGLVHLYEALCVCDAVAAEPLQPADVTERALQRSDPHCVEALALFAGFLGGVAGNVALTFGARGGVYIAGGVVPRLGQAFDAVAFRERFVAKGRFRGYLEAIATFVITADDVALRGIAAALDAAGS